MAHAADDTPTPPRSRGNDVIELVDGLWAKMPLELALDPAAGKWELKIYAVLYYEGFRSHGHPIDLTQEVIAAAIGSSEKSVSRALAVLEDRGWVERELLRHGAVTVGTRYRVHSTADTSVRGDQTRMSGGDQTRMSGHSYAEPLDVTTRTEDSPVPTSEILAGLRRRIAERPGQTHLDLDDQG